MKEMTKKALVILFWTSILLGATALTEYLFYRQDEERWVERFEDNLHRRERWADEVLESLRDSVVPGKAGGHRDVLFLGFHRGKISFWTEELVGDRNLYGKLMGSGHFVKLGNTYYEVRSRKYRDNDYFALLKIKDVYPYTNKYVKNSFGSYLGISEENTPWVEVHTGLEPGAHLITNKEGNGLFFLSYAAGYKEQSSDYLLLIFYGACFLALFYVYSLLLRSTSSWRRQLGYFGGFVVFLVGLRWFMQGNGMPSCVYRLPEFENRFSGKIFFSSIGDLILTTFCLFYLVYLTLAHVHINYANRFFRRYRHALACGLVLVIFLYVDFYNFTIDTVVENMDIHLNIAQIIPLEMASIVSFAAIVFGGLIGMVGIFAAVSFLCHYLSFRRLIWIVTAVCIGWLGVSVLLELYTNFWDCCFIWSIFFLVAVNKYMVKSDVQRSIYMLAIFLTSLYVVMISEKYERYKEQRQRLEYATELIEERDYNFEQRLAELDHSIASSDVLAFLLGYGNYRQARMYLQDNLLDLSGYNYYSDLAICSPGDTLWLPGKNGYRECREYFDSLIGRFGYRLGNSHFYAIRIFDGLVSYIGKFHFGELCLYLRFDATETDENIGYPQILSRKSATADDPVYRYSYAKYLDGSLVSSTGDFVYPKKLLPWGENPFTGVRMANRDGHSHMLIAADNNDTLVISLPERTFALYYMNVFYAFLFCMLLSSYGVIFNVNENTSFRRGMLKTRIKNSVIWLIFTLLLLFTAISIYTNTKSFEGRHKNKAVDFLRYVNKELERLDCVDCLQCPEILRTLANMSDLLLMDINIYASNGELVATSRPEIFRLDFRGTLINPRALQAIARGGATSYIERETIGNLEYMSAYMPLVPANGKNYILNIPYFAQNDELNLDIIIMMVITVNIAIVMMVVAFILSGAVADRVIKPLENVNDRLRRMHVGGKNEKLTYKGKDEIGTLVRAYNDMVDKLDASIVQLARSERESAWREMARQIAHEIKNPLTPMKLNIQFMLRSLQMEDPEKFKQRFRELSAMLMEQIDNMAATASAFSDFAKLSVTHFEVLRLDEVLRNCILLFGNSIAAIRHDLEPGVDVLADREQMRRVIVNLLKNAEQSIPPGREGVVSVTLRTAGGRVELRIRDNGCGIPGEIRGKIFEPNFTTKSGGSGLGLSICRRIIENFGGEIGFTSEEGAGTEFYIFLDRHVGK